MKKAELLQKLNDKFYKVLTPAPQGDPVDNLQWYLIKVFDKIGDAVRDMNIAFYVENEGEADEVAYWSPSEPKPDPVTGFSQEVNDYIQSKIDTGTIEGAFIVGIDEIKEIANGIAIIDNAGTLEERKIFVDKDAGGNLRHRQII